MDKTVLVMGFKDEAGGNYSLRLDNPRENLQGSEVTSAMNNIVGANVFTNKGLALTQVASAKTVRTVTEEIDLVFL